MKKKLDSIWNEVQTSLPEIDFESDFKTDDFELVGNRHGNLFGPFDEKRGSFSGSQPFLSLPFHLCVFFFDFFG